MPAYRFSCHRLGGRAARVLVVGVCAASALACSGVELILKTPTQSACEDSGLSGCDEIAGGLVAYVEGDAAKGKQLVLSGAARNSPEALQELAESIAKIGDIPGAKAYMGPIGEVADLLRVASSRAEGSGDSSGGSHGGGSAKASSATVGSAGPRTRSSERALLGEPSRVAGHALPLGDEKATPCEDDGEPGFCVTLHYGPLVLTDLSVSPLCGDDASVIAVLAGDPPRRSFATWIVHQSTSGGVWPLAAREEMVARVAMRAGQDRRRCTVSWAGYLAPGAHSGGLR